MSHLLKANREEKIGLFLVDKNHKKYENVSQRLKMNHFGTTPHTTDEGQMKEKNCHLMEINLMFLKCCHLASHNIQKTSEPILLLVWCCACRCCVGYLAHQAISAPQTVSTKFAYHEILFFQILFYFEFCLGPDSLENDLFQRPLCMNVCKLLV